MEPRSLESRAAAPTPAHRSAALPVGALRAELPGGRLHLQHGPIDLVIAAAGKREEISRAYEQATTTFADVLAVLVAELPILKQPVGEALPKVRGPVAQRMTRAVFPYRDRFITPMAAVAGSVAQHVLEEMTLERDLEYAYVNNGGDIAVHLAAEQSLTLGIVARLDAPRIDRRVTLSQASGVRGIATSGWGGRSFSLGIADAVTVFAADAASADAAATIIGNAVNVDHPGVQRAPAASIQPDTDLRDTLVTIAVDVRDAIALQDALDAGSQEAQRLLNEGLILGALIHLGDRCRTIGWSSEVAASLPKTSHRDTHRMEAVR